MGLFEHIENRSVFRPTPASVEFLPPCNERVRDVFLDVGGVSIHAWWCPTPDWRPERGALLHFHGNAGNLSHRGEQIRRWQEYVGLSTFIIDYPGYGKSGGSPSERGCYEAANAAHDWLAKSQGVRPADIVLLGGSLGGAVALEVAVRRPHKAVVLIAAFTSLAEVAQRLHPWLPVRWVVGDHFDNLAKIRRCPRPVFIAHGTMDRLIPFEHGERLFAAAPDPKTFLPMVGYEHNHTPGPEFYAAVLEFLRQQAG